MRQVELFPGIHSSALGFGCAPILGAVGASESIRAIAVAREHGINHFDLARSYGYGDAEQLVGRCIATERDAVRIATKFGIRANWKARLLRPLKPLARRFKRRSIASEGESRQPAFKAVADRFHDRVELNSKQMERSVNESLRALKTDFIDYLFVHEPMAEIQSWQELLSTAFRLKRSGKIRCFGLATPDVCSSIHDEYLGEFDLLQFAKPVDGLAYSQMANQRGETPNIIFSPMRSLVANSPQEELLKVSNDFRESSILCTMFNPDHIAANARVFQ